VILSQLSLFQVRNLERVDWEPHPRANLLLGANAQGKTNLLESIFFLGTTKTLHQAASPDDLIQHDANEALLRARVIHQDGAITRDLEAQLKRGLPKRFLLNFKKLSPLSKIFGQLPVVLFTPEDLDLVKAGPAARRLYLDLEISQASQAYLQDLANYHRALKQRNAALKLHAEGRGGLDNIHAFDEALVLSGCAVLRFRLQAVRELNGLAAEVQTGLAGPGEILSLQYRDSLGLDPAMPADDAAMAHQFRLRLRERAREEQARGGTLSGPHRDDLELSLNGRPAKLFASQGQQRCISLSLKLAEVRFLAGQLGENPVLLLDDVLSELDLERQARLLSLLDSHVQTFVTSTHATDLAYQPGQVLTLNAGRLSQNP